MMEGGLRMVEWWGWEGKGGWMKKGIWGWGGLIGGWVGRE